MKEISPREMLERKGHWTGRSEYITAFAEERGISERMAQIHITKAYRRREIKKHVYPDRTTMYGLEEFGPPAPKIELITVNQKPAKQQTSSFLMLMLIATVLLVVVASALYLAYVDPSLVLLNQTLINPTKYVPTSYIFVAFAFLSVFLSTVYTARKMRVL
jgi:hypothetical protein